MPNEFEVRRIVRHVVEGHEKGEKRQAKKHDDLAQADNHRDPPTGEPKGPRAGRPVDPGAGRVRNRPRPPIS
jgi:hypothetical protein